MEESLFYLFGNRSVVRVRLRTFRYVSAFVIEKSLEAEIIIFGSSNILCYPIFHIDLNERAIAYSTRLIEMRAVGQFRSILKLEA